MPRVQVDIATIDQDQAAALVAHHLAMAAAMFQALPEDNEDEVMHSALVAQFDDFGLEYKAAVAFTNSLINSYDALKDEN